MSSTTAQRTIRALRSDLALQIARHVRRTGSTQVAAARKLAIPQPTLSKIMRGQVQSVSLELMLRIAVRAGLPVTLQTGKDASEAGVFVAGAPAPPGSRKPSRIADEARRDAIESMRALTPEQRLEVQRNHNELVTALQRAGIEAGATRSRSSR